MSSKIPAVKMFTNPGRLVSATIEWTQNSNGDLAPIATLDGETFDLSERAFVEFNSPDSTRKLTGMIMNLWCSISRLRHANAPEREISLLFVTFTQLTILLDGNFSGSMWRAAAKIGRANKVGSRSQRNLKLRDYLMVAVELRRRIDGKNFNLARACSRVATDVDHRLKTEYGTSLESKLPIYSTDPSGDPGEVNRTRKQRAASKAGRLHPLHNRIAKWFDSPSSSFHKEMLHLRDTLIAPEGEFQIETVYNLYVSWAVWGFADAPDRDVTAHPSAAV